MDLAHLTHLAALHAAWQNTRRAAIKTRVQLAVTRQTINRIEQQAQTPSESAFFRQVLQVRPPMLHALPSRDAGRNKVWLAVVSDSKVDANLLASIDMLQPDPAHRDTAMASHFRPFWLRGMGWLVETELFQGMEAIRPRSRRPRLYKPELVCI